MEGPRDEAVESNEAHLCRVLIRHAAVSRAHCPGELVPLASARMIEVEFPRGDTAAAAIEWFKTWSRVRDEAELSIRATSALERVSPTVLLAACASARQERKLSTRFELDGEWQSWNSFHAGDSIHSVQTVRERPRSLLFVHTYDLASARRAADMVADALHARSPAFSPSVVRMVRFVFEELGANVVQHSGAPRTGLGWADVDASGKRFALAFADCGVGFRASLQRNPDLTGRIADDAEALQLALTPRISGTASTRSNMGWGLKALVDMSDLLDAELRIASGAAMLTRKTSAAQRTNVIREIPPWQGCWIAVEATLK